MTLPSVYLYIEKINVQKEISNVVVFQFCSVEEVVKVLLNLGLSCVRCEGFIAKFSCESVMKSMATDIIPMLMTAFPDY